MSIVAHLAYLAAAVVGVTLVLLAGVAARVQWFRNVFRAWDYLGAALLGGDGRHSISAYCGARDTPVHRLGRRAIDGAFGRGHCAEAAQREGLTKA